MSLCIIFDKLQVVLFTKISNLICICIATVKVHNANSLCLPGNSSLYLIIIYLKGIPFRLHQNRFKVILCNCKNRSDIRISGDNYFVTRRHYAQFDIGPEYPDKGIQPIGATDTILRPDVVGIIILKSFVLLPLKIPSTIYNTTDGFVNLQTMQRSNVF